MVNVHLATLDGDTNSKYLVVKVSLGGSGMWLRGYERQPEQCFSVLGLMLLTAKNLNKVDYSTYVLCVPTTISVLTTQN